MAFGPPDRAEREAVLEVRAEGEVTAGAPSPGTTNNLSAPPAMPPIARVRLGRRTDLVVEAPNPTRRTPLPEPAAQSMVPRAASTAPSSEPEYEPSTTTPTPAAVGEPGITLVWDEEDEGQFVPVTEPRR